ncbi:hypothetical protein HNP25_002706 [Arcicella rosea]|uniref:Uncharacterized protein n=1 Tax=Arcicella rosea TaxID=502909 RepID=A0A841EPA6_9BACT|nr:hypothetical protein [Arcicella rosea]
MGKDEELAKLLSSYLTDYSKFSCVKLDFIYFC